MTPNNMASLSLSLSWKGQHELPTQPNWTSYNLLIKDCMSLFTLHRFVIHLHCLGNNTFVFLYHSFPIKKSDHIRPIYLNFAHVTLTLVKSLSNPMWKPTQMYLSTLWVMDFHLLLFDYIKWRENMHWKLELKLNVNIINLYFGKWSRIIMTYYNITVYACKWKFVWYNFI